MFLLPAVAFAGSIVGLFQFSDAIMNSAVKFFGFKAIGSKEK